jgi:hypothetical protein
MSVSEITPPLPLPSPTRGEGDQELYDTGTLRVRLKRK